MKSNQINSVKPHGFYRWVLVCSMVLLGFKSNAQTSFYITDRVLGNSGSLDVVLASAVTSANLGNNVTVYFNVAPDAQGQTLCIVDVQLADVSPTSGSILLTPDPANTNQQGIQFEDNLSFQKIFHTKGGLVHFSKIAIRKKPKQMLFMVGYSELKKDLTAGYAIAVEGKVKFTFDEEYKIESGKYLSYKLYDDNHILKASSTLSGVVTGGAQAVSYNFDDNRYIMNLSGITDITAGKYYTLEVETSTGDKRFLRILYKY